jgi:hypothetical protein
MTLRIPTSLCSLPLALLLLFASGGSALAQQPPQIFFAEAPALLVRIQGVPVYQHIGGTDLERVVNTRVLIVRDAAGVHYLKAVDGWMESYELLGDWSVSGVSPFGENTAAERAAVTSTANRLDAGKSSAPQAQTVGLTDRLDEHPPTIFVSTTPAALVVTDGPPRYDTIAGTSLQRLANSQSMVFLEPTDGEYYARVNAKWYRTWTLDGRWQSVADTKLPADIAKQVAR